MFTTACKGRVTQLIEAMTPVLETAMTQCRAPADSHDAAHLAFALASLAATVLRKAGIHPVCFFRVYVALLERDDARADLESERRSSAPKGAN